jgi:hypothetical protein
MSSTLGMIAMLKKKLVQTGGARRTDRQTVRVSGGWWLCVSVGGADRSADAAVAAQQVGRAADALRRRHRLRPLPIRVPPPVQQDHGRQAATAAQRPGRTGHGTPPDGMTLDLNQTKDHFHIVQF